MLKISRGAEHPATNGSSRRIWEVTEGKEDDGRHWVSKDGRGGDAFRSRSGGVRGDSQLLEEILRESRK